MSIGTIKAIAAFVKAVAAAGVESGN